MKKIAILLVIGLCSCGPSKSEMEAVNGVDTGIELVKIDGCEYLFYSNYYRGGSCIVHKANCKNH